MLPTLRHALRRLSVLLLLPCALLAAPGANAETPPRVLVFGDSNSWGWIASPQAFPVQRLDDAQRWPGVLGQALNGQATVQVDALSGRTVDVDYPEAMAGFPGPLFNGSRSLAEALAREAPVDLLVLMLGTNDLRADLGRSPQDIAQGLAGLVRQAAQFGSGVLTTYAAPRVLLVVPPPLGDVSATPMGAFFAGMQAKSRALAPAVRQLAQDSPVAVFDAADATGPIAGVDGVHLTAEQHQRLGHALAPVLRQMLVPATKATHRKE